MVRLGRIIRKFLVTDDLNVNLLGNITITDANLIRNFKQMALERIYLIHVVPKTDAVSIQFREEIPLQVSPWRPGV